MFYRYFFLGLAIVMVSTMRTPSPTVDIKNDHPFIYYHGRWDSSPGTWWSAPPPPVTPIEVSPCWYKHLGPGPGSNSTSKISSHWHSISGHTRRLPSQPLECLLTTPLFSRWMLRWGSIQSLFLQRLPSPPFVDPPPSFELTLKGRWTIASTWRALLWILCVCFYRLLSSGENIQRLEWYLYI